MKRMINGAVSDISHALKQPHTLPGGAELPSPSVDFIFVPGSGILVPQTELMKINSGSLQVNELFLLEFALSIIDNLNLTSTLFSGGFILNQITIVFIC